MKLTKILAVGIFCSIVACKQEIAPAPTTTAVPSPSPIAAAPAPVIPAPAPAAPEVPSRYVKISDKGARLPRAASVWSCVLDTQTGKTWEVKTKEGLHNYQNLYGWYDPKATDKGISDNGFYGSKGLPYTPDPATVCHRPGRCDTEKFIADVNAAGLCGHNDWSLPTKDELLTIVVCPKGRDSKDWLNGFPCVDYLNDGNPNHIDGEFFPNSGPTTREYSTIFGMKTFQTQTYWASDNYDPIPSSAYFIKFRSGGEDRDLKSLLQPVRLVR